MHIEALLYCCVLRFPFEIGAFASLVFPAQLIKSYARCHEKESRSRDKDDVGETVIQRPLPKRKVQTLKCTLRADFSAEKIPFQ